MSIAIFTLSSVQVSVLFDFSSINFSLGISNTCFLILLLAIIEELFEQRPSKRIKKRRDQFLEGWMQMPSTKDYLKFPAKPFLNSIITFLDTSKRRHALRAKQASVSKKLKEVIHEYCQLFRDNDPAKILLVCEQGTFSLCNASSLRGVTGKEYI